MGDKLQQFIFQAINNNISKLPGNLFCLKINVPWIIPKASSHDRNRLCLQVGELKPNKEMVGESFLKKSINLNCETKARPGP